MGMGGGSRTVKKHLRKKKNILSLRRSAGVATLKFFVLARSEMLRVESRTGPLS